MISNYLKNLSERKVSRLDIEEFKSSLLKLKEIGDVKDPSNEIVKELSQVKATITCISFKAMSEKDFAKYEAVVEANGDNASLSSAWFARVVAKISGAKSTPVNTMTGEQFIVMVIVAIIRKLKLEKIVFNPLKDRELSGDLCAFCVV